MTTSRLQAFSDGVFAIATLLVRHIGVPRAAGHDLAPWSTPAS